MRWIYITVLVVSVFKVHGDILTNDDISDIQVKLIGGLTEREGNVYIFIAGRWGMFCDFGFDYVHAEVICRMLGYQRGLEVTGGPFAEGNNTNTWKIKSRCTGTAATLSNCTFRAWWHVGPCIFNSGAICGEPDIQVKLIGGRTEREGNVDICIAGRWGNFCDYDVGHVHAEVICRMLGYQRGLAVRDGPFAERNTTTSWWIKERCNGAEDTLSNCILSLRWYSYSCSFNTGVICGEPDIQVKLIGGRTKHEGNVDICIAGGCRIFCDKVFDNAHAEVICRMLGYQRGLAVRNGPFAEGNNTSYWRIDSRCNGAEDTLSNCKLSSVRYSSWCDFNAGVICGEPDIRLVGGNYENEGRIEININGRWGTICAELFDSKDAIVLCRFLSQPQSLVIVANNGHFGKGNATIEWKIKPNCHGNETSLSECQIDVFSTNTECSEPQAGVICGDVQDIQVKLIGGWTEREGNVGILIAGRWGMMCDSNFHNAHAEVICRMIGYQRGIAITNGHFFDDERNTTLNWDINSRCNGTEATLSNCKLSVRMIWYTCHYRAGVICDESEVPEKIQSGDHGIGIFELIGGLLGVVSVAVLAFGVFIYYRRSRRIGESSSGADAQTIQEPIPRPRSRRMSSHYDDIADADVLVNDYDTIGNPDAVYLELIDHYDQLESLDELSIADPNDGYLHPNVHGTGGEVTESGDGDEDSPPNDVCSNDDGLVEMDIE